MLHKLEKELDDVDLKIGDRWRILDRYIFYGDLSDVFPSFYKAYEFIVCLRFYIGEFRVEFPYNDDFEITERGSS